MLFSQYNFGIVELTNEDELQMHINGYDVTGIVEIGGVSAWYPSLHEQIPKTLAVELSGQNYWQYLMSVPACTYS